MAIYTCVLLDVDNTLLDFDAAERQALIDMLAEYELPHDARACEIYHAVNRELWDALAKGQLTKPKLFQQRFGRFMKAMDLPDNGKAVQMNDRYEELLSTHADLLPGALTALEELSEVATLAIVSNGAVMVQEARIRDSGIERYMDGVYISEKVGAAKPSAKLFEHVLKDLGITNRSRVLMVGDDLLADIKGGQNAGLDTCWFNLKNEENKSNIHPKFEIGSYEDLYKIVMEPISNLGWMFDRGRARRPHRHHWRKRHRQNHAAAHPVRREPARCRRCCLWHRCDLWLSGAERTPGPHAGHLRHDETGLRPGAERHAEDG